jgi:hypothetical protein
MALLERFSKESLNRREKEAFSELADTLVFETPQHFKLSRKNVPELSRLLQEAFRKQDELHEEAVREYVADLQGSTIAKNRKALSIEIPEISSTREELEIVEEKKLDERSFTEQVLDAARMYIVDHGRQYWQSQGYDVWGFTPKLAAARTKKYIRPYERDGKNCFGVVQGLGGIFNQMGLAFEMGITADHPFAVVQVEGITYLASLFGMKEAKGTFEQRDGYKMYTPAPEDKIPYKLMTVWNFDEALVYELLENFEVLRQMSLGNEVETMPGSEESGMRLTEQYRGALQAASWRDIQSKVTPRLATYFRTHQDEWAGELERVSLQREINHFFEEVMDAGQAMTSMEALPLNDFYRKFLPVAKQHRLAIRNFILSDVECGPDTPSDVVLFARGARDVLNAIQIPALRAEVTKGFLRPFDEKDEPLTERPE